MCWFFYMGIVQIALDPPPLSQTFKRGKECPKPSWEAFSPPPPPLRLMPIWKHISKRGFPKPSTYTWLKQTSVKMRDMCGA